MFYVLLLFAVWIYHYNLIWFTSFWFCFRFQFKEEYFLSWLFWFYRTFLCFFVLKIFLEIFFFFFVFFFRFVRRSVDVFLLLTMIWLLRMIVNVLVCVDCWQHYCVCWHIGNNVLFCLWNGFVCLGGLFSFCGSSGLAIDSNGDVCVSLDIDKHVLRKYEIQQKLGKGVRQYLNLLKIFFFFFCFVFFPIFYFFFVSFFLRFLLLLLLLLLLSFSTCMQWQKNNPLCCMWFD